MRNLGMMAVLAAAAAVLVPAGSCFGAGQTPHVSAMPAAVFGAGTAGRTSGKDETVEQLQGEWFEVSGRMTLVFEGDTLTASYGWTEDYTDTWKIRIADRGYRTEIESVEEGSFGILSPLTIRQDGSLEGYPMVMDGPSETYRFVREDQLEKEREITDYSDEDAPKEIRSDEIEYFSLTYTAAPGRDYGVRFGSDSGSWNFSVEPDGDGYVWSVRGMGNSYIIFDDRGEAGEEMRRALAGLIRDLDIPALNGYHKANNVDVPGYSLYVEYASGEDLTILAEGNAADTCVFDLAALMDFAAELCGDPEVSEY